jgi:hypothetical protein
MESVPTVGASGLDVVKSVVNEDHVVTVARDSQPRLHGVIEGPLTFYVSDLR